MKKVLYISLLICTGTLLASCDKKVLDDVEDYYPAIETASAEVLEDGSVKVTGKITSIGGSTVKYAGVSMGTDPDLKMQDNQEIFESGLIDTFSIVYPDTLFRINTTYYFRAWAVNDQGYTLGEIIKVESVAAESIVAPCNNALNTVNVTGSVVAPYTEIDSLTENNEGQWTFTASNPNVDVNFSFGKKPRTRIYKAVKGETPSAEKVFVSFEVDGKTFTLNEDVEVIVNEISADSWEVIICDGDWKKDSKNYVFNTRLITPL